jgi:hypothetical protein
MSKPTEYDSKTTPNNAAHRAVGEIISAMSALNMYPEELPGPHPEDALLSETDKWAAHACEHLNAAIRHLTMEGE